MSPLPNIVVCAKRLFVNTCQGNERDNAYGAASKIAKHVAHLRGYGIIFITTDAETLPGIQGKGLGKYNPSEERDDVSAVRSLHQQARSISHSINSLPGHCRTNQQQTKKMKNSLPQNKLKSKQRKKIQDINNNNDNKLPQNPERVSVFTAPCDVCLL